ncbi:MAG: chemotaxis protein CheA [Pseudomonadota bacterium]|nr:chemotaxis protein CheA [Pseudomonadota bacterium]
MDEELRQILQIFLEESSENLDVLEQGLLRLEQGPAAGEELNVIFRAAHSIKGGAATFGLDPVAEFTHVMETLLDQLRSGRRQADAAVVRVLLQAVDALRALLAGAVEDDATAALASAAPVREALEAVLAVVPGTDAAPAGPAGPQATVGDGAAPAGEDAGGWRLQFLPHPDIWQQGNDPARILRALGGLGELHLRADLTQVPSLEALDPAQCHLGWQGVLRGEVSQAQIEELFDWVAEQCELRLEALDATALRSALAELDSSATGEATAPAAATGNAADGAADPVGPAHETATPPAPRAAAAAPASVAGRSSNFMRVSTEKIDALLNLVGELVITQSMLQTFGGALEEDGKSGMRDGLLQLERHTRELQERVMQIRMLPISFTFNRLPRLVHDLSAKLDRQVELRFSGEHTELDKTVLEQLADPLVHLVRNALDHGIEAPAVREAKGKAPTGLLHLSAFHEAGNVIIRISDDGNGLDGERILAKARERGLIEPQETPDETQLHQLIFHPGFSTAEQVSDVSGRGVGMDVVSRNIVSLGGRIEVQSSPGVGTSFTIRLPLTLAILDGQLIRVGSQIYVVPLLAILETIQLRDAQLRAPVQNGEVCRVRDEYVPVVRLARLLDCREAQPEPAQMLMIVESDGQRIGLAVNDLLSQQQVVIKSLQHNYRHVPGIAGATILGDGRVALILDVQALSSLRCQPTRPLAPAALA